MSILWELGLGVGFGYPTHTQILRHLKASTQNPYPNTQKNPYPYPKPIPKYSKKLRVYSIFPFFCVKKKKYISKIIEIGIFL